MAVADQIADPWYAAQAYAWCGRFAPAPESGTLVEESFRRARAGKDAYQRLAATAWPLRALIELGRADQAAIAFDPVASVAPEVQPPSSRAEACFMVFEAVAVGPRALATRAYEWLVATLQPSGHWRQQRAIREATIEAVTLGLIGPSEAPQGIKDERLAAKIAARLTRGDRGQPRAFF